MSGEGSDLNVPPAALADIAKGINLAHAELKDLGMIGEASVGRGFSDLALSGMELGHTGLTDQFQTFCDRWEWGVRALTLRGNGFAQGVGLSAGSFAEQEQYVKDSIKIGVNSLNGNPHLTEEEVKGMSWDKISTQSAFDGATWSPRVLLRGPEGGQPDLEEHRLRRHGRTAGLHGAVGTHRSGGAGRGRRGSAGDVRSG